MSARYLTYEEAHEALAEAVLDTALDQGLAAVEAAHSDLVRYVAAECTAEVAAELLRREGVQGS